MKQQQLDDVLEVQVIEEDKINGFVVREESVACLAEKNESPSYDAEELQLGLQIA